MTMLIITRTIQGVGSGGVDTPTETIILDLVPLRDRAKYLSYGSVGTTVGDVGGPFIGGLIVVKLGWRWVFYLNVILGGVALVKFFFFLRVKHRHGQALLSKVKRIDFGGDTIFIGAVVAVLLALTWGGPVHHWNSAQILVPLIIGLLGLLAFITFEWTPRLAPKPSFPRAIVSQSHIISGPCYDPSQLDNNVRYLLLLTRRLSRRACEISTGIRDCSCSHLCRGCSLCGRFWNPAI